MRRVWVLIACLLGACAPAIQQGTLLGKADFSQWTETRTDTTYQRPEGDSYRITSTSPYAWTLYDVTHSDVVIEATLEVLSADTDNGYGVACRANPRTVDNEGYYFMVSSDGFYGIFRRRGKEFLGLRDWRMSEHVRQGKATNTLRVVCLRVDETRDYLALWVNGHFEVALYNDTRGQWFAPEAEGVVAVLGHIYGTGEIDVRVTKLEVYQPEG